MASRTATRYAPGRGTRSVEEMVPLRTPVRVSASSPPGTGFMSEAETSCATIETLVGASA